MKEATAVATQPRTQADELEDRLVDFAVRIVRLSAALPRTAAGRAESTADFIHKVRIVFKELNETLIWLRVIQRSQMLKPELTADILNENLELCRIFAATLKTARQKTRAANA